MASDAWEGTSDPAHRDYAVGILVFPAKGMVLGIRLTLNQLSGLKFGPVLCFYCRVELRSLMFNASVWVCVKTLIPVY